MRSPRHTFATATDRWLGRWIGPEGTFLLLEGGNGVYEVTIQNLDGPRRFQGAAVGEQIEFDRDGVKESLRATDGAGTGMKWLSDKADCLTIRRAKGSVETDCSIAVERAGRCVTSCSPSPEGLMKHKGSCHCGRVAFEVEGTLERAMACNCSICERKGSLLWFVPHDKFRLLTPEGTRAPTRSTKASSSIASARTAACIPTPKGPIRKAGEWLP